MCKNTNTSERADVLAAMERAVRQKIVDAYLAGALDAARALGAFLLSKDITAAEIAKWMTAGALRGRAERYALKQSSDSVTEPKTNQP